MDWSKFAKNTQKSEIVDELGEDMTPETAKYLFGSAAVKPQEEQTTLKIVPLESKLIKESRFPDDLIEYAGKTKEGNMPSIVLFSYGLGARAGYVAVYEPTARMTIGTMDTLYKTEVMPIVASAPESRFISSVYEELTGEKIDNRNYVWITYDCHHSGEACDRDALFQYYSPEKAQAVLDRHDGMDYLFADAHPIVRSHTFCRNANENIAKASLVVERNLKNRGELPAPKKPYIEEIHDALAQIRKNVETKNPPVSSSFERPKNLYDAFERIKKGMSDIPFLSFQYVEKMNSLFISDRYGMKVMLRYEKMKDGVSLANIYYKRKEDKSYILLSPALADNVMTFCFNQHGFKLKGGAIYDTVLPVNGCVDALMRCCCDYMTEHKMHRHLGVVYDPQFGEVKFNISDEIPAIEYDPTKCYVIEQSVKDVQRGLPLQTDEEKAYAKQVKEQSYSFGYNV